MTRRYTPRPDEIAVVLVAPEEVVTVVTERGDHVLRGDDSTSPYPEVLLALVPFAPPAVGWGETTRVSHGVGSGTARTPTGLRAPLLRRVLRGHKLDEPVWTQARELLGGPDRAIYVRVTAAPYYSRTRLAATAVRIPQEEP